jgi:hypothetical protein
LATVSFENVPIIAVVEVSSSDASNWTFSAFLPLEIAIALLPQTIMPVRISLHRLVPNSLFPAS